MAKQPPVLPDEALEMIARRFRVLGDVRRLRILKRLLAGACAVSEIVEACGSSQANVSMHLAQLRGEGLVEAHREGTRKIYHVADPLVADLCRSVCVAVEDHTAQQLARLRSTPPTSRRR